MKAIQCPGCLKPVILKRTLDRSEFARGFEEHVSYWPFERPGGSLSAPELIYRSMHGVHCILGLIQLFRCALSGLRSIALLVHDVRPLFLFLFFSIFSFLLNFQLREGFFFCGAEFLSSLSSWTLNWGKVFFFCGARRGEPAPTYPH